MCIKSCVLKGNIGDFQGKFWSWWHWHVNDRTQSLHKTQLHRQSYATRGKEAHAPPFPSPNSLPSPSGVPGLCHSLSSGLLSSAQHLLFAYYSNAQLIQFLCWECPSPMRQRESRRLAFKINFQEYKIKSNRSSSGRDKWLLSVVFLFQWGEVSPSPSISRARGNSADRQLSLGGTREDQLQFATEWLTRPVQGKQQMRLLKSDLRCPITIRYWWLRSFWNFSQRK